MLHALAAATAGSLNQPLRALAAAYTIVPTGTIAEKQARLVEVEKLYKQSPGDPYIFGEKAQLENDLKMLQKNKEYARQLSKDVSSGKQRFLQGLSVNVPDMSAAVSFWKGGMGAIVLDTRLVDGVNVTRVGYGSQSLDAEDGAKFALELVEAPGSEMAEANGAVEYIQLALPVFRISQAIRFGGEIISAYGWTELVSPGGLPLRVHIDEGRRDPFEFVALRTTSMEQATNYFKRLGMQVRSVKGGKKINSKASWLTSNSIFENEDATDPEREVGATLVSFEDPAVCTGCLLLAPKRKETIKTQPALPLLRIVGTAPDLGPDRLNCRVSTLFTSPAEFEGYVKKA